MLRPRAGRRCTVAPGSHEEHVTPLEHGRTRPRVGRRAPSEGPGVASGAACDEAPRRRRPRQGQPPPGRVGRRPRPARAVGRRRPRRGGRPRLRPGGADVVVHGGDDQCLVTGSTPPARGAGVAALVEDDQVALVRLADGRVHAVGDRDPRSGATVMSRSIVGSRHDRPTLAETPVRAGRRPRDRRVPGRPVAGAARARGVGRRRAGAGAADRGGAAWSRRVVRHRPDGRSRNGASRSMSRG